MEDAVRYFFIGLGLVVGWSIVAAIRKAADDARKGSLYDQSIEEQKIRDELRGLSDDELAKRANESLRRGRGPDNS